MEKNQSCRHVAIIMDGNGRWAKKQNRERTFGHMVGVENVRNIAIRANDLGIEVLTLYAFSTENWKRPLEEVNFLMKLPEIFFKKFMKELMEKNIRIRMIGEWEHVPQDTRDILERAIKETSVNTGMILNFAFNYGGKREIVLAAQKYAQDVRDNGRALELTEDEFTTYLMGGEYPPVDLMIRTSGEQRISNFLLWEMAYAEMMFLDVAWPEFTTDEFEACIRDFMQRDRRYGGVKA